MKNQSAGLSIVANNEPGRAADDLALDDELFDVITRWLDTKGSTPTASMQIASAVEQIAPHVGMHEAMYFADGLLCGVYLMQVRRGAR